MHRSTVPTSVDTITSLIITWNRVKYAQQDHSVPMVQRNRLYVQMALGLFLGLNFVMSAQLGMNVLTQPSH